MAPVKYFGKPTTQRGKYLWDVLGNLKNFGVGRVFVRSGEVDKFPGEMSFYKVVKVEPAMDDKHVKSQVYCERVFRGAKINNGLPVTVNAKICEWQLIPRSVEKKYVEFQPADPKVRIAPSSLEPPPLMKELLARDRKGAEGTVRIPYLFEADPEEGLVKPATEGETPDSDFSYTSPRMLSKYKILYENLPEFDAVVEEGNEEKLDKIFGRARFRDILDTVKGEVTVDDKPAA